MKYPFRQEEITRVFFLTIAITYIFAKKVEWQKNHVSNIKVHLPD